MVKRAGIDPLLNTPLDKYMAANSFWQHHVEAVWDEAKHRVIIGPQSKKKGSLRPDPFLEREMEGVVGLSEIKAKLRDLAHTVRLNAKFKSKPGTPYQELKPKSMHMTFKGNPGSGKTFTARLIGKLLYELKVVASNTFVEVKSARAELVAGFVGQTAEKTRAKFAEAKGGILFIDEAYQLSETDQDTKDYGREALNEFLTLLEEDDAPLVIVAGYSDKMDRFLDSVKGLRPKRFKKKNEFFFPDYTPEELAEIFLSVNKRKQFRLSPGISKDFVATAIGKNFNDADRSAMNAQIAVDLFESAVEQRDFRLDPDSLTHDSQTIFPEDIQKAIQVMKGTRHADL